MRHCRPGERQPYADVLPRSRPEQRVPLGGRKITLVKSVGEHRNGARLARLRRISPGTARGRSISEAILRPTHNRRRLSRRYRRQPAPPQREVASSFPSLSVSKDDYAWCNHFD